MAPDYLDRVTAGGREARWRDRLAGEWVSAADARARRFSTRLGFRVDGARGVDPDTGLGECRLVRHFGGSR